MPDRRGELRLWLIAMERFEYALRGKVARTRNTFLKEASDAYDANGQLPAWIRERHIKRLKDVLWNHYEDVIPAFAALTLRQIKSRRIERKQAQSIYQALIAEWVKRESLRKAQMIAATDANEVRNAIQDGIDENEGTEAIARRIRKVSALTPHRAATIARTETHAAATYATASAAEQAEQELGVRLLKVWLPTMDDRTRDDHRAMTNHPAIPLDELFRVGDALMDRPGDPSAPPEQTINCRCALAHEEAE